jgi:hypothetical protein
MTKSAEARALSTDAPDVDAARREIEAGEVLADPPRGENMAGAVSPVVPETLAAPPVAAASPRSLPAARTPTEQARQAASAAEAAVIAARGRQGN